MAREWLLRGVDPAELERKEVEIIETKGSRIKAAPKIRMA